MTLPSNPVRLHLGVGLDRSLAWSAGSSVRYLVAELSAEGTAATANDTPALNLALAVDVSGSMAGEKIEAARHTAATVAAELGPRDRLTMVAFDSRAELLLDACPMDEEGRAAALAAVSRLRVRGQTNLSDGWLLAAERVATGMAAGLQASHRVVLLTDGQANQGVTDGASLAHQAGELLARGLVTSAVGIGDDYDEGLLGAMTEAGGGQLHDAGRATEIAEVVLGELRQGRTALLERVELRFVMPVAMRAEVVGPWAHLPDPATGSLRVQAGMLLPNRPKQVVVRLHCPAGETGTILLMGVSATGTLPDGSGRVEAGLAEVELRLAPGQENTPQPRHPARSLAALQAWQGYVLLQVAAMNRDGDLKGAKRLLEQELRWMRTYAEGLSGTVSLIAEAEAMLRRAAERWNPRVRKAMFTQMRNRARFEQDQRADPGDAMRDQFGPGT